ncbi:unnamed protein product [Kluyveromyces dobzhanskii CBS 2104]|uniref:WGS project CCBQ000000000 data, contig 00098 n=1 Tax=Kluyveromyces dobzhanskii CBS 2104 TaxID=1427455 RepID=A0A0A8L3J5_9SACH|nr:unnamed protein product [Kluyveromyces dobzhanskii CBS 2104]
MPVIEEIDDIDDIDNLEMDLAELDANLKTPVAPKLVPTVVRSQDQEAQAFGSSLAAADSSNVNNSEYGFVNGSTGQVEKSHALTKEELEEIKEFQMLYPCYFDARRSQSEGRRAPLDVCVENPLAKTIADAARSLGIPSIFEGSKTHPQDFGNPGRVRVLVKENHKPFVSGIQNKRVLMKRIGEYLKNHPTTLASVKELPYGPDFENVEPTKIPLLKGAAMNDIVPLHSPFLTKHPMTKSLYDAPAPLPPSQQVSAPEKQVKPPKNKFRVVRR